MPRPDCPRCGSDLVVAAASTAPSESVLELRSGTVGAAAGAVGHWLCRACGHQWDPVEEDERPSRPVDLTNPAAELRGAREQRGRTLSEAATATRIEERHLSALERDAPLGAFPAPVYARFFLREYAEYLRLDPDPLLREFEARHAPVEEAPVAPPRVRRRTPRTGWSVLVVLSIAAMIILIALRPSLRSDEEAAAPSPPAASASPSLDSGAAPPATPPVREPNGVRAVLRLSQASWVEAISDGEVVESSTLEPGTTVVVYRARDLLQLTLGNAGGVRLRVNGELVATGDPGAVVTLGLDWQDGELLIERA